MRVFGSVARGEDDADSDIDLLVDLESGRSLFDLGGLLTDLEMLLGRGVDIVTEKGLRHSLRERVLQEAIPIGETTDCAAVRVEAALNWNWKDQQNGQLAPAANQPAGPKTDAGASQ